MERPYAILSLSSSFHHNIRNHAFSYAQINFKPLVVRSFPTHKPPPSFLFFLYFSLFHKLSLLIKSRWIGCLSETTGGFNFTSIFHTTKTSVLPWHSHHLITQSSSFLHLSYIYLNYLLRIPEAWAMSQIINLRIVFLLIANAYDDLLFSTERCVQHHPSRDDRQRSDKSSKLDWGKIMVIEQFCVHVEGSSKRLRTEKVNWFVMHSDCVDDDSALSLVPDETKHSWLWLKSFVPIGRQQTVTTTSLMIYATINWLWEMSISANTATTKIGQILCNANYESDKISRNTLQSRFWRFHFNSSLNCLI